MKPLRFPRAPLFARALYVALIRRQRDDILLLHALSSLNRKAERIMAALDELTQQVSETNTVIDSAITLLRGLKQRLDEAGTDPAKLQELRDSLDAKEQELAQAVAENTPAQ